jgi:CHASE2 domain-containing sensor protein
MKRKQRQIDQMRMKVADFDSIMRRALLAPTPATLNKPKETYVSAAVKVLRAEGHPLTTKELFKGIVGSGLRYPTGLTPYRTLESALYVGVRKQFDFPIKQLATRGPNRAIRGSVRWALCEWPQET